MSLARAVLGPVLATSLGVTGCLAPFQGRTPISSTADGAPRPALSTLDGAPRPEASGSWSVGLAEVLALAGAKNIDIEIVSRQVEEARAGVDAARALYLPDLRVDIGYTRHDGRLQETRGAIYDVSRQSALVGPGLSLSVDLARAHFERLRALQLADAAEHMAARTRAETIVHAAVLARSTRRADW